MAASMRCAKQARRAPPDARYANVARHACFAMRGMHAATPPSPRFQVLEVAILAVQTLRPVVARIRQCDRDLGEQIRRALSSVALNIGEANRSEGGNRLSRFSTAAGSNAEVRAALRVAVAWGYVSGTEVEAGEQLLDRIAAMLYKLGTRR